MFKIAVEFCLPFSNTKKEVFFWFGFLKYARLFKIKLILLIFKALTGFSRFNLSTNQLESI